ncbi:hypothetical protein CLCR_05266 [Cladophialophora carrionii]|uniref:Uncharacterized protein n=1 Tax=Cladophialophora carrionii TaxID=86049 RepID=A0A1C1CK64_9EURO|nr:hypothetical protein CLCR_05266 [Cladophialophora carrionii]
MRSALRAASQFNCKAGHSAATRAATCGAAYLNEPSRRTYSYCRSAPPPQQRTTSSWLPVPFVTETLAGMTHTTDLFSRLLKERIVALYGEVDDRMA